MNDLIFQFEKESEYIKNERENNGFYHTAIERNNNTINKIDEYKDVFR